MNSKYMDPAYQREVDAFVQREVIYCVSSLVWELSKIWEHLPSEYQDDILGAYQGNPDYEEAATNHGWVLDEDGCIVIGESETADSWEEACSRMDIDLSEYQSEVYEHWVVSNFLANDLEAQGEKIIRDFMGIEAIWCRQTTGQSISMDRVICDVWDALQERVAKM